MKPVYSHVCTAFSCINSFQHVKYEANTNRIGVIMSMKFRDIEYKSFHFIQRLILQEDKNWIYGWRVCLWTLLRVLNMLRDEGIMDRMLQVIHIQTNLHRQEYSVSTLFLESTFWFVVDYCSIKHIFFQQYFCLKWTEHSLYLLPKIGILYLMEFKECWAISFFELYNKYCILF